MLKRHEIEILLKAGHGKAEVARLAGVSLRSVNRIAAEPPVVHVDDAAERGKRQIGSIAIGQWKPLKITPHLQHVKVYEVLNAIVAQNGKAIWTVMARPEGLSKLQNGGIWYVYLLEQPFKGAVSEGLANLKP